MIICSCNVISSQDIEQALIEILALPKAPLPTPGVVFRHLAKRMQCCGCAPLTVDSIYKTVEKLEREGAISADAGSYVRSKLVRLDARRKNLRRHDGSGTAIKVLAA